MPSLRAACALALAMIIFAVAVVAFDSTAQISRAAFLTATTTSDDDRSGVVVGDDPFEGRRLQPIERLGIAIPERSLDSRECDDFDNLKPCTVADGYVACFECIETRFSLRSCVHVSEPLTVYDERNERTIVIPANSSPLQGYCLRERLARDVRAMNAAADEVDSGGSLQRSKRECSVYNADWLLVRRRRQGGGDSAYNFVCRCKYPHLMANMAGPMSACSRDVACNEHGRLDEAARLSRSDPLVNGRCLCDDGWVASYDEHGVGPYCREATFGEWPSAFFGVKRANDDIDLDADAIDAAFRRSIELQRRDDGRAVWLPNPCGPCDLTRSPEGTYFCGDRIDIQYNSGGQAGITSLHIGVRQERDYLANNGGRLPNACTSFGGLFDRIDSQRILMQFMSQSWNDGTLYAQEIGFLVDKAVLRARGASTCLAARNRPYERFVALLQAPKNSEAISNEWGVVWTYSHRELREHRAKFCRLAHGLQRAIMQTDLYYRDVKDAWFPFASYTLGIPYNAYYRIDGQMPKQIRQRRQWIYKCPDRRGLDRIHPPFLFEVDEHTAEQIVRSMAPTCYIPYIDEAGECQRRFELNILQDNPTACIILDASLNVVAYAYALWYPADMNALQFAQERNLSQAEEQPNCGGDGGGERKEK